MTTDLFDPPRWPGGPRICIAVNLPAFETLDDVKAFQAAGGEAADHQRDKPYLCDVCGCFHYTSC